MYVCMYVCMCVCTYVYVKVCISMYICVYACILWYTCMHASTYTHAYACVLGCIECPWKKIFSSQSTNKGNRKLPFYMGFKNIEKFFRNFNVSCSYQRVEVTENRDFP